MNSYRKTIDLASSHHSNIFIFIKFNLWKFLIFRNLTKTRKEKEDIPWKNTFFSFSSHLNICGDRNIKKDVLGKNIINSLFNSFSVFLSPTLASVSLSWSVVWSCRCWRLNLSLGVSCTSWELFSLASRGYQDPKIRIDQNSWYHP